MKKKMTKFAKATLAVGIVTLLLLVVMNTEVSLHPLRIHIYKAEKLLEVFVQICALLFLYFHGRWEGFKDGMQTTLDTIRKEIADDAESETAE